MGMIERAFERARLTIEWNERRVKRTYEGTIPILLESLWTSSIGTIARWRDRTGRGRTVCSLVDRWKREGKVKEGKKRVCRVGVAKITRTDIMVV